MRENLPRRKQIRLKEYDYSQEGYYFITICTQNKKHILSKIINNDKINANVVGVGVHDDPKKEYIKIELLEPGKIIKKQIELINLIYKEIRITEYVIMPNHIHVIIEISENNNKCGSSRTPTPTNMKIPSIISTLKRLTNKKIGKQIWQRSYYEHIIRNEKEYYALIEYIINNPAKWAEDKYYN